MTPFEYLSVLTSVISVAIALVTVLFIRTELRENRRYNEISIRPLLTITQHFGGSQGRYGIAVKNVGLGPAIINRCQILIGLETIPEDGNGHGWNAAIKELKLKNNIDFKISKIAPDGKIVHGDRIWLLYIGEKDVNKENIDDLEKAVKSSRLNIVIEYESMFGKPFTESFL